MTIKIDAPKGARVTWWDSEPPCPVRIVRESDFRKIMAVIRACDAWWNAPMNDHERFDAISDAMGEAMYKLDKHTSKK